MCHVWTAPVAELSSRLQPWSVQPCVRPLGCGSQGPLAVDALRGSGPVIGTHSTMRWRKSVVLIAGSTGSALRAVRPFRPSHHAGVSDAISFAASTTGSLCGSPLGHHRQTIRAILLASAMAATLVAAAPATLVSQGPVLGAIDLGVTDDGERAGHEQAARMTVTLFADTPSLLALPPLGASRHQPNPGREVAP